MNLPFSAVIASLTLWIPPIHELGHIILCETQNVEIYSVTLASMTHASTDRLSHITWDYITIILPFAICILYLIQFYRSHKK